jgi:hypothetical protein
VALEAAAAELVRIPAVAVVAKGFETCAVETAKFVGVPNVQLARYPGAFNVHSDSQLAQNVTTTVFPQIVEALTKQVKTAKTGAAASTAAGARAVVFTGTVNEVNKFFTDQKWSDGMAIIPPTEGMVKEFLKYTDRSPDEEIAVLSPAGLKATPWNIAVNGVMAGCRPEYMPVLIALVQAIGDPKYPIEIMGSTSGVIPYVWINGPVGRQLKISNDQGIISWPANRAIARAFGLIWQNIAGYRIQESQMGTFGYPLPWVLAENEEFLKKIGWKPFHVEKGFDINTSTVSPNQSNQWGSQLHPSGTDPKVLMENIAWEVAHKGSNFKWIGGYKVCLITPPVIEVLARGYTKQSLKEDLIKTARETAFEAAYADAYGWPPGTPPKFEDALKTRLSSKNAEKGKLPPWMEKIPGWEEIVTLPAVSQIEILACGDPFRNKSQTLCGIGGTTPPTKEIKLPANWDKLMAGLGYPPLKSFYL